MLPDDRGVLLDDREVLSDDRRVLPDDREVLPDDREELYEKMIINIELCIADEECGDVKISLYFTVNIQ